MDNAKVSIIIPVFNSEKYIIKCLKSILCNTYKNIEIIAINDGSTDRSRYILDEYEKKYSGIIQVIHQKNKGVAITRNDGIRISTGDYIMFIDNDDYIDRDYIQTYIEQAQKYDADIVIGGYRRPDESGKVVRELKLENEPWAKYMIMAPWAKIYKKDYLIDQSIVFLSNDIGEDVYFNLNAILSTSKIKVIDYIGYNWFFNNMSVSNTVQKDLTNLNVIKLLESCYESLRERRLLKKEKDMLEYYFTRYIIWFLTFSCKKVKYQIISKEYDRLFRWLNKKFRNYKKNPYIGLHSPKGEASMVQKTVFVFMLLHKLHLGKALVFLYGRF